MTTSTHAPRMSLAEELPAAYAALVRLDRAAREHLDERLLELVKLRVSQLNVCGYCLDLHAPKARQGGESQQRLDVLAAWREVPFFDERERAALALAEAVTRLGEGGVPDDVWQVAEQVFPRTELAALLAAVVVINAWNRVAVTTRMVPGTAPAA
jgi:AhpD family alkylhydroperoxidase